MVNQDLVLSDSLKLRLRNHSHKKYSKINEHHKYVHQKVLHPLKGLELMLFEIMMISPVPIALGILYTTHEFLITLAVFHVALVGFPILFLMKKGLLIQFLNLVHQEKFKSQYKRIFMIALVLPCVLLMLSYVVLKKFAFHDVIKQMRLPNLNNSFESALLFIDFVIINPFVEELFWRIFCHMFVSEDTECGKFQIAFHFAFYHWFVIFFIFQNVGIACLGFMGLTVIGFILTHMKINFGILFTIFFHVGMDLAVALVLIDAYCDIL